MHAHYASLYRFGMSLTRSESDTADLVQETFLIWAKKGHQLRDASKAKSWLFTTLHRRFLEGQRRVVRFPQVELEEAGDSVTVEPETIDRLDGADVLQMIGSLEPQYGAAVALFYLEDYSYEEIGQILNVPLGTVKSRIARGIAHLKKLVLRESGIARGPGKASA